MDFFLSYKKIVQSIKMASLSQLKNAIRRGDTEQVSDLASELSDDGIDISSALKLARDINRVGKTRGKWDDIVEILEKFC